MHSHGSLRRAIQHFLGNFRPPAPTLVLWTIRNMTLGIRKKLSAFFCSRKTAALFLTRELRMRNTSYCELHSRPQNLRFFWSRGRRNGGLWSQPLPDVRKSRTSGNACVILVRVSAHAHKTNPEGGERGIDCIPQCKQIRFLRNVDSFLFAELMVSYVI